MQNKILPTGINVEQNVKSCCHEFIRLTILLLKQIKWIETINYKLNITSKHRKFIDTTTKYRIYRTNEEKKINRRGARKLSGHTNAKLYEDKQ